MKNFLNDSRDLFVKTLESISSSADRMANNAKYKAKEMSIINSKKELMKSLSDVSYELFLKGVHFPLEIEKILDQIAALDEEHSSLKAAHYAYLNPEGEPMKEESAPSEEALLPEGEEANQEFLPSATEENNNTENAPEES